MPQILLLNPNTNASTTNSMVQLLRAALPASWRVRGVTATQGTALITNAEQLHTAAQQVQACWQSVRTQATWDAVVLACYADPALHALRQATGVPTVGIGQAALLAASAGGQYFGIATTTPDLDAAMRAQVQQLGLSAQCTGLRYTHTPATALMDQPQQLQQELLHAVQACAQQDGAQRVVIGGGPLGAAALQLAPYSPVPLIAPLSATARWLQQHLQPSPPALQA